MRGLILLVVLSIGAQNQRAATFGAELLRRSLPVPSDAADLEQPITSYSTLDDERGFAIAYYGVEPDGMLHELRVRSFDPASRTWRKWTQPEPIGSVTRLHRAGPFLIVTGHSSPSASPLLVFTEALELKRELNGWPELVLTDGRVLFVRSMVHFAPAHAAALALYDPAADREVAVYPHPSVANERGGEKIAGTDLWMDRSIDTVKLRNDGTIEISVIEQRVRLDRDQRGIPAGSEERRTIVCTIDTAQPVCRRPEAGSRKLEAGSWKLEAGSRELETGNLLGCSLRQRPYRVHHRHQSHPFAHRDVLPEDLFDDVGGDRGDFAGGKAGEGLVEDRGQRLRGDP